MSLHRVGMGTSTKSWNESKLWIRIRWAATALCEGKIDRTGNEGNLDFPYLLTEKEIYNG